MKLFNISKLSSYILYKNNHVSNIYEACTCCYDNTKSLSYLDKKKYIKKRIDSGHESILEHGRLAIKISNIPNASLITELTTLEYSRYLEFYCIHKENNEYNLIINGNMRSYKYFFTNTTVNDYERNILIRHIHSILISNTVGELYGTKFKMYDEIPPFVDIEYLFDENKDIINKSFTGIQYNTIIESNVDFVATTNKESVKKIKLGVDVNYCYGSTCSLTKDIDITVDMLLNIIPVTILFENMSRTATHQLVRHRNAITQESQRYVDYKDSSFTIPVPGYDSNKKYNITLFGQTKEVNLSELAIELMSVYEQLTKAGLKKEEARAYLPSNVNCRRLYMTFTLSNLFAFLKLRTDSHAQFEIRQYANTINNIIDTDENLYEISLLKNYYNKTLTTI